jgi:hypothetical protein
MTFDGTLIPLWIKLGYTLLVCIIVAVYAVKYPPANFLWFSDIALLGTVPALWLESSLMASMMALAVLLPDVLWNASFFVQLARGKGIPGLTDYMFDSAHPRYVRAFSLYHVFMPVLLVWLVIRLGYSPQALPAQSLLCWIVLALTYRLTDPKLNVNWVFGPGNRPQQRMAPLLYLGLLMVIFPVLVYLPTHLVLRWLLE